MYAPTVGSILLVESDPDARERAGSAVRDAGHEPVIAISLREAFLLISEGGIDVVVIDSNDPRVGVVELVRSMEALPDAPPVVLISSSPHAPEISARIGAAAFLTKPYEPSELITLLAGLLGELRPVRIVEDEPSGPVRQFSRASS
jgi:DNA-binding NtrC family response regulator